MLFSPNSLFGEEGQTQEDMLSNKRVSPIAIATKVILSKSIHRADGVRIGLVMYTLSECRPIGMSGLGF